MFTFDTPSGQETVITDTSGDDEIIIDSFGDIDIYWVNDNGESSNDGTTLQILRQTVAGNQLNIVGVREEEGENNAHKWIISDNFDIHNFTISCNQSGGYGDDLIVGTNLDQEIFGLGGSDAIWGNGGNDILHGGSGNDYLFAGINNSILYGDRGNDELYGDNGDDILEGGAGNDTLDGGNGNDTLNGGDGNDYLIAGTGNNTLYGDNGNDRLNGDWGNDTVNGGTGNDTLEGGLGNDTLTGGLGTDFFVFNTALSATTNKDTITDFNVVDDTIKLENAIMTKLGANGTLTTSQFKKGAGFKSGKDADDHIIYNTTTGALYYDSNGSGAGGSVQIALIGASSTHAALTYADFVVI
jgi:Ca2+-binding RTX toxin-like protein